MRIMYNWTKLQLSIFVTQQFAVSQTVLYYLYSNTQMQIVSQDLNICGMLTFLSITDRILVCDSSEKYESKCTLSIRTTQSFGLHSIRCSNLNY